MADSREIFGIFAGHASAGQQLHRIGPFHRFQADASEQAVPSGIGQPGGNRRFPAAKNEPHVVRQYREERLAQPSVHQAEQFISVESDNYFGSNTAQARGNLFGRAHRAAARGCKLAEKAGFGGFNTATVQSNYCRAFRACDLNKRTQKPRLSDPRNAIEVHHNGPLIGQKIMQRAKLLRPADEGSRRLAI